jgi:hypothetical protein
MSHSRAQGSKTSNDNKHQLSAEISSKKIRGSKNEERNFDLVIDGVPYSIRSTPFLYNGEIRFNVIVNNDTEHVFTWDSQVNMLRAIDDDGAALSDRLEEAISEKLQSQVK